MRRCPAEGTLRGYFDGELSDRELAAVTAHLASCEACTLAAREMEAGIETLRQAFAPLISLPIPASRLKARLDTATGALPPPKRSFVATAGFELFALFTSLTRVSNMMPRSMQGFAVLVVALLLLGGVAVVYESRLGVNEQAKNEIVAPPVSSNTDAHAKQEEITGNVASGSNDNSVSDREQALSCGFISSFEATVNQVNLKSSRDMKPTSERGKSYGERRKSSPSLAVGESLIPGEQKQLEHIATLTASLEDGAKPLNPILRVEYERNVAVVDVAIKATRRAALNNPRDKNATGFLLAAYQSKINLLRAVALHADPPASLLED